MRHIYTLLLVLLCLSPYMIKFMSTTIIHVFELFVLFALFANYRKLYKLKSLSLPKSGHVAVVLLLLMSVEIVVRGDWNRDLKGILLSVLSHNTLAYVLPFIILPLPNAKYTNLVTGIFMKGAMLVIPLWLMDFDKLVQDGFHAEGIGIYLPVFAAFLLGYPSKIKDGEKKIMIAIWAVYLVLMLLNARRNMVFLLGCYGLIAYYCTIMGNARKRKRSVVYVFLGLLACLIVSANIDYISGKVFNRFSDRLEDDTRSGVEELFMADFAASPVSDWIWGRGKDGGYYQEVHNEDTGEITFDRKGIETGYLQLILKGGVIYAAVIIYLILLAFVKSIKVKNNHSVFLRWLFLLYLIDLYATTLMCVFTVKAIIFWFTISVALSRDYSSMGKTDLRICRNGKITNK